MFAEDPGGVAHLAYHKEAGRVSGVVEEHPGGAVHPDHDHGTVQVVGVVAEEPGDVHQGAGLHSYIREQNLPLQPGGVHHPLITKELAWWQR